MHTTNAAQTVAILQRLADTLRLAQDDADAAEPIARAIFHIANEAGLVEVTSIATKVYVRVRLDREVRPADLEELISEIDVSAIWLA